jgi:hypothetical protein
VLDTHLQTRSVVFTPARPEDGPDLYRGLARTGMRVLPPVDAFSAALDGSPDGDAVVFAIRLRATGEIVGAGSLRDRDPAGHVKVGIYLDVDRTPPGAGAEAMMLLVNYAFAAWPQVRKVYILTTDASRDRFRSAVSRMPLEAVLPGHVYFLGRLWDLYYYAIGRQAWEESGALVLRRFTRPAPAPAAGTGPGG